MHSNYSECARSAVQVRPPRHMDETLYEKLLASALSFVSYRPRSEREIRTFLEKKLRMWKVAGKATVNKVVSRLGDYGYLDDKKFVLWWAEQRRTFRPKSVNLVRQELLQKGVAGELLDQLLTVSPEDELDQARKILRKRLPVWSKLPLLATKKKIYAFLGQRGFSMGVIRRLIDEVVTTE